MSNCNPPSNHDFSCEQAYQYGISFVARENAVASSGTQALTNMIVIDAVALKEIVDFAVANGQNIGCLFGLPDAESTELTGVFFPVQYKEEYPNGQCNYQNYSLADQRMIRQTWIDPTTDNHAGSQADIVNHFFGDCS